MSRTRISRALRRLVEAADEHRCAFCQSAVSIVGMPFEVDHVIPESLGGRTVLENLCLCCGPCNEHKACRLAAIDPTTGRQAILFHPRREDWWEHFRWSAGGTRIEGRTPTGRATVFALQMNRPVLEVARQSWVTVGWHPPKRPRRGKRPR